MGCSGNPICISYKRSSDELRIYFLLEDKRYRTIVNKYEFTIDGMRTGEYYECLGMEVVLALDAPVRTPQLNYV